MAKQNDDFVEVKLVTWKNFFGDKMRGKHFKSIEEKNVYIKKVAKLWHTLKKQYGKE